MTVDVDYLPRGTLAYELARWDHALRFCRFQLRRGVRDLLLGMAWR